MIVKLHEGLVTVLVPAGGGAGDVPPEGVLPAQLRVVGLDLGPVSRVAGAHKLILAAPLVIGLAVFSAHHTWKMHFANEDNRNVHFFFLWTDLDIHSVHPRGRLRGSRS